MKKTKEYHLKIDFWDMIETFFKYAVRLYAIIVGFGSGALMLHVLILTLQGVYSFELSTTALLLTLISIVICQGDRE